MAGLEEVQPVWLTSVRRCLWALCTDEAVQLISSCRGIEVIKHGQHILYTHRQNQTHNTLKKKSHNGQGEINSTQTVAC